MATTERDREDYYRRVETELGMAQQSTNPDVVKAHYELAGYYLDLAYGDAEQGLRSESENDKAATFPNAKQLIAQLRAVGIIVLGGVSD